MSVHAVDCDMDEDCSCPAGAEPVDVKPLLKWAGGKRWLTPKLLSLYERAGRPRLIDPFVGGLSVPLALRPEEAVLGDLNPHLINFYRQVKRALSLDGVPLDNSRASYLTNRARFNHLILNGEKFSAEAAALFYVLNRTGYNGLCRFSRAGRFNTPFGKYAKVAFFDGLFPAFKNAIAPWGFVVARFEDTLRCASPGDFVYADPPYDGTFAGYTGGGFTWDDQARLAALLAAHRGPVVASNAATDRIIELYTGLGFEIEYLSGPRRIACNGDRTKAKEILAMRIQ